ncbi:MAG TPA: TonB-dependent receptor [Steroidobacteraceae bacterium]|jgi:iron complex outermembrane receptor protein|nr:TonB-dependent receptor [Steroidobacteraceae bacterium]
MSIKTSSWHGSIWQVLNSCGATVLLAAMTSSMAFGADPSDQLETIIITAQKRVENLQSVPISADVVSGQAIAEQNQTSLETLSETLSGVHIQSNGANSDMYIRGIGSGGYQSVDESVVMFVDDIYHGRSRTTAASFLDIDHVEVLKGPQSTYFGNSAIAGAVNILTNKPTDELSASARMLYGMYGQYAFEGAVGGPFTDTLAIRAAFMADGGTGWIKNVNFGQDGPDTHDATGRVTLRFRPVDNFEAMLKVEDGNNTSVNTGYGGAPFQMVNCPPPAGFPTTAFGGACATALATKAPLGVNNNETAGIAGEGATLNYLDSVLTANYQRWGQTFTSVTGFYKYQYSDNTVAAPVSLPAFTSQFPENYRQFSEELRVASPTDQTVEYLFGAYYQTDRLWIGFENNYTFLSPFLLGLLGAPSLAPFTPIADNSSFTQKEDDYSVFGSVTWNITSALKLTGGIRGSVVDKNYVKDLMFGTGTQNIGGFVSMPVADQLVADNLGLGIAGNTAGSRTDRAWQPSAKLQYEFEPQVMGYLSYAKGFKPGGFNSTDTSAVASNANFGPEHVNAYEAGVKSEFFDRRLLVNLDVFRSDYTDLQVSDLVFDTFGFSTLEVKNAASSRAQGVELQEQALLTKNFRLSANVTYDETKYLDYPNAAGPAYNPAVPVQNLSGRPTEFSPLWSGNVAGAYSIMMPANYRLTAELSAYFSSSYYLHETDEPEFFQGGYVRLDGRLSLETPDRHWAIDLIGKNLTDRVIIASIGSPVSAVKEEPANVAIQVRYHY